MLWGNEVSCEVNVYLGLICDSDIHEQISNIYRNTYSNTEHEISFKTMIGIGHVWKEEKTLSSILKNYSFTAKIATNILTDEG